MLFVSAHASAFNITFDKALKVEMERCKAILPMEQLLQFTLTSEYGFLSEAELKKQVGEERAARFSEAAKITVPYLESLDERGEIMDLNGKEELTVSCAKFVKGMLITPYQKLAFEMIGNALSGLKKRPALKSH